MFSPQPRLKLKLDVTTVPVNLSLCQHHLATAAHYEGELWNSISSLCGSTFKMSRQLWSSNRPDTASGLSLEVGSGSPHVTFHTLGLCDPSDISLKVTSNQEHILRLPPWCSVAPLRENDRPFIKQEEQLTTESISYFWRRMSANNKELSTSNRSTAK